MHYKKILAGGATAAVIIGAGGTALAVSGSDTTPGKQSGTGSSQGSAHSGQGGGHHKNGRKNGRGLLRRLEHGQVVTRKKDGTVTHDLIRGNVSSVSATSITVVALDKTSETFAVTKDTKVRVRDNGARAASSIDKVAKGDRVLVAGIGTSTFTAKHVVDVKGRSKHQK